MSRSVSAPSSVTYTSPCWNGLIVPGSTLRYGSNFCSWTRRPRALSSRPSEAATIPFPSADTTPPVTKTYFGARALTGFQGSRMGGRRSQLGRGLDEVVQPAERLLRQRAAEDVPPGELDREGGLRAASIEWPESELCDHVLAEELEAEPARRLDGADEEHARRIGLPDIARPLHLPAAPRRHPAPVRLDAGDAGPPVGQVVRLGDERPDVLDRREQDALRCVPLEGTPSRLASPRHRPAARPRSRRRSSCAWGRPGSSPPGSAGRRRRRSAAGA